MHTARQLGCVGLVGRCYEEEGTPPLVAYITLLEQASRLMPAALFSQAIEPSAPELAKLMPELYRLFPNMPPALEVPPSLRQRFLFTNFLEFLTRCSSVAPLVIFVDDLQWADESTLLLLQHLVRRPATAALLVLATYRDTELEVSRPLVHTLEALTRLRAIQALDLRRLKPGDVRELTASPAPLPPGTYTRAAFKPAVTLTLDEGWTSVNRFDDFFDVQQDVGSPDVIAVQLARPRGFVGRSGVQPAGSPPEVRDVLSGNPGLTLIESSDSRIGGLEGQVFVVENRSGQHAGVMELGPGRLGIDSGRRLWIACFTTPDGLVAVMVGGSVEKWTEALAAAEPVLESIHFP